MGTYDDDDTDTNPGDLRDAVKKANKKVADLEAALASAQAKVRRADISEVLQNLGLKPKVAKLIPADVEPTEDAIKNWAKDYEDVIGPLKAADTSEPQTTQEPETNGQTSASSVPDEYVAAMTAAQQTASTGIPLAPDPTGIAGKLAEAAGKNLSFEDTVKLIQSLQHTKG